MPTIGDIVQFYFATKAQAQGQRPARQAQALSFATGLRGAAAQGAADRAAGAMAREVEPSLAGLGDLDAAAARKVLLAEEALNLDRAQGAATIRATDALTSQRNRGMDPAELERLKAQLRIELENVKGTNAMDRVTAQQAGALERDTNNPSKQPRGQVVTTPKGVFIVDPVTGTSKPVTMPGGSEQMQKPTEGTLQATSQLGDMATAVQNIRTMLSSNPGLSTGAMRGAGIRAAIGSYTGTDRDLVTLRNEASRLFDLVYLKSGKQINPNEQAILARYLPDVNQDPQVFADNLNRFMVTLEQIAKARNIDLGQFTGGAAAPSPVPAPTAPGSLGAGDFPEINDMAGFEQLPIGEFFSKGGRVYRKSSATGMEPQD